MKIFSTIVLYLICFTTYSQVQKASTIEEIFNKEFPVKEDNKTEVYLVTPPEVLPDWFFNPPQGSEDVFYAVGISDPWIDNQRGREQAKFRAYCLASFMQNITAKGLSDVFNEGDENYKLEQISHFYNSSNAGFEGIAIDSFVTKYQEHVFQYKFTVGKALKKLSSQIEYYKSAIKQDVGYSKIEKFELFGQIDDLKMKYGYVVKNTNFEIESLFNSDTIMIKPTPYHYTQRNKINDNDSIAELNLFRRGLWQGFFKSLIDNLDLAASDITTKQKSVSEMYKNEKGTGNFNQLNRGVYNISFSFIITSIELINKEMVLHLKTRKIITTSS
jgi:hypothetical protein